MKKKKLKFYSFDGLEKKLLKDKKFRKAYDDLQPAFAIIEFFIRKRIETGLSRQQLAKKAGISRSAFSGLENGTYNPTIKFLQRVAVAVDGKLKVTII